MTFNSVNEAKDFISNSEMIGYSESFDLSKYCAELLRSEQETEGREIAIRVKDAWNRVNDNTKPIWNDILESAGLYPYVDSSSLSKSASLRFEFHKSTYLDKVYFHSEQQLLAMALHNGKAVVVSAPTSFGKSLLIEDIVASRRYKQIVIVQPTLALLDETRKKLLKYRDSYKLIVSTSQVPDTTRGNIFLFTGERVVEYSLFSNIDFFVIDEFYKLSLDRDDDRAIALNQAFNRLLRFTSKFYLLGPMIKDIPASFQERFQLIWFPTKFATVAVNEHYIEIPGKPREKKEHKKQKLFELLSNTNEQTLIYCSAPNKATVLALEFIKYIEENKIKINIGNISENNDIIEWIDENVNSQWSLNQALKHGVAFHHGALPRHLGSSIVDSFNKESIRWLFCTSTLIEGVNTSAKTVILFDKEKGKKDIDFFDYKNIAGRSGRMNRHYIGHVIRFEKQPAQMDLFVDIPLFNQEQAPLELLISLNENEVSKVAKDRLKDFESLDDELKTTLRKNSGIAIEPQLAIIKIIESNLQYYQSLLTWSGYPVYKQLLAVIELAWNHLLKPGENKADIRTAPQLTVMTIKYATLKSVKALISDMINDPFWINEVPEVQERINRITFFVLNVTRHWFDYKLPKWIAVINTLQEYVFLKNKMQFGNYSFYATSLENSFLPANLAALTEYDIPYSAIAKLRSKLQNQSATPEAILSQASTFSESQLRERFGLINYEIKKIKNSI